MLNYIKNNTLVSILNFSVRFRYGNVWAPRHPSTPGGRLNKKDGLTRYGNSHVKDKTS